MNPTHLYQLSDYQHQAFQHQPDDFIGNTDKRTGYTESFHFLRDAPLRFWYNTQRAGYAPHCHGALEIIVPIEQNFSITVGKEQYTLEPGDIFLIPLGTLHSYPRHDNGARFIFLLETSIFSSVPGFSYISSLLNRPITITNDTHEDIYAEAICLMLKLAEDYWTQTSLWQMRIYANLMSFFTHYGTHCLNQTALVSSSESKNISANLNKLFEYVEKHYADDITLSQAAALANYSKNYFARIFKSCTGQTFMEYLRNYRISEATKLLLDNQLPITTVAFQSGFSSLPTFNRIFRQAKGCAPSEYRSYYSNMSNP